MTCLSLVGNEENRYRLTPVSVMAIYANIVCLKNPYSVDFCNGHSSVFCTIKRNFIGS